MSAFIHSATDLGLDFADVWRTAQKNHETYSKMPDREADIQFLALGLCGEAGELANFIKKRWRDRADHYDDIVKEIADVMLYAIMLANVMGETPSSLVRMMSAKQDAFVAKMKLRDANASELPAPSNNPGA